MNSTIFNTDNDPPIKTAGTTTSSSTIIGSMDTSSIDVSNYTTSFTQSEIETSTTDSDSGSGDSKHRSNSNMITIILVIVACAACFCLVFGVAVVFVCLKRNKNINSQNTNHLKATYSGRDDEQKSGINQYTSNLNKTAGADGIILQNVVSVTADDANYYGYGEKNMNHDADDDNYVGEEVGHDIYMDKNHDGLEIGNVDNRVTQEGQMDNVDAIAGSTDRVPRPNDINNVEWDAQSPVAQLQGNRVGAEKKQKMFIEKMNDVHVVEDVVMDDILDHVETQK